MVWVPLCGRGHHGARTWLSHVPIITGMLKLCREVRFTIDPLAAELPAVITGHSGNPCNGTGYYFALQLTVAGNLDPQSQYLVNIRKIDQRVRDAAAPMLTEMIRTGTFTGCRAVTAMAHRLASGWDDCTLISIRLSGNPFLAFEAVTQELPMVRLSQHFEFSASHRLHNPELSDQANRELFGKCNNPLGHGHNYEVEVTLRGPVDDSGRVIDAAAFERIVHDKVLERFDHKHLNLQTEEFKDTIPTVENIARVIYGLLKTEFEALGLHLAAVKVWETPKTSAQYSE